jgi:hypothetical protein
VLSITLRIATSIQRQILNDYRSVIAERHFGRVETARFENFGESRSERFELSRDRAAAGDIWIAALRAKPRCEFGDQRSAVAAMRMDILPRDVGDIALKPIAFAVKDDAGLQAVISAALFSGPQEQTEFERHVETWEGGIAINFSP